MDEDVLAIVVAEFNEQITGPMLAAALDEAATLNVKVLSVSKVPGAYEIPLVTNEILRRPEITAVVVLGFIEKGETLHGEVMGHTVTQYLLRCSLDHGKAVGLGIIGPGALLDQAESRKDSYARAAVRAAVASSRTLRSIRKE